MKLSKIFSTTTGAAVLAVSAMATPFAVQAEASGNIGVYSAYVLRGITNDMENGNTAVQGGLDWSSDSTGIFLGYWGSNLDYTSGASIPTFDDNGNATGSKEGCVNAGDCPENGFENDFYGGWAGQFGDFGVDVGLIYYYYLGVMESNGLEIPVNLSWRDLTLGMKYLTNDVTWGNAGDIYWTLGYDFALPADFTLGALLGYYTYEKGGEFIQTSTTEKSSAFRHFDLTLSHPIGETGADMSITAIFGGEDRFGNDQANTVVLGVSYGFDI